MSSKSRDVTMAFATVVVLAIGITIYLEFFLPHCRFSKSEVVRSGDNSHFAYLEWSQCGDLPANRWASNGGERGPRRKRSSL